MLIIFFRESSFSQDDSDDGADGDFDGDNFATDLHINAKDQEQFELFMNPRKQAIKFSDLISQAIDEKKTDIGTEMGDDASQMGAKAEFLPEVVEMYEGVGKVLKMYRSGKVPKAFKVR